MILHHPVLVVLRFLVDPISPSAILGSMEKEVFPRPTPIF
jgi:hypothetical protein